MARNSLLKNCITDLILDIELTSWFRHLRKLLGFNIANCRFLEISGRATFGNKPVQVIAFDRVVKVEISPITLLKSGSSREPLLGFLKNRKTHRNYFGWSQFSV